MIQWRKIISFDFTTYQNYPLVLNSFIIEKTHYRELENISSPKVCFLLLVVYNFCNPDKIIFNVINKENLEILSSKLMSDTTFI